ncbi:MAG: hypothetical protein WB760_28460 [Xanthobacteraceae bacterium]
MRAVEAHGSVVRLLYVRQRSHAVGKPIAMLFSRHSAAQFAAETVAADFAFRRIAADAIADLFIALPTKFVSKLNDKPVVRAQAFGDAAKVRVA